MYLLDTNMISEIAKNPTGEAARRFSELPSDDLCTSVVVSAEVLFGFENGAGEKTRRAMTGVLNALHVLNLEPPADKIYAETRAAMSKMGKAVTPNDMFIAAHALAIGAIVVTDDQAFHYVPGLKVENWLQPRL